MGAGPETPSAGGAQSLHTEPWSACSRDLVILRAPVGGALRTTVSQPVRVRPGLRMRLSNQPVCCPLLLRPGLEYQRPKRQASSDDIEVISMGTPMQQESPELYRKGTTPSDLTPDDSPLQSFPASPSATPPPAPAARNKVAHFSRQVSVDEERGGDIQMLLEGRGGDYGRHSWGEEKAGGSRGVRSGTLRSGQPAEDFRTRGSGHKQPGNPKPRERRTESPPAFWTSHPRASNPSSGGAKLLELDEEKLSNYEMEMKPLLRVDSHGQEAYPQKRRYSRGAACRGLGEDRGFGAQRLRSKSQNKENVRPAASAEPAVQRLESLRLGDRAEPRLLRWDLTFSPPQKSSPVARESDEENGDALKSSTVSGCAWGVRARVRPPSGDFHGARCS